MKRIVAIGVVAWVAVAAACSSSDPPASGSSSGGADGGSSGSADGGAEGGGGTQCSRQRDDLLVPIAKVSTGEVTVLSTSGKTKTILVDASAGGTTGARTRHRLYLNLERAARVDVTDPDAFTNTDWDLALKRTVIYTNSGDGGSGQGGAVKLVKGFASVTDADLSGAKPEKFFDADCNVVPTPIGDPASTFADWYDYDTATNLPTPRVLTYGVVGGTGKKYKVMIESYSSAKDGGAGDVTGIYRLKVEAL